MKGTEKQIKWAQDIIEAAYESVNCMARNIERNDKYGLPELPYNTESLTVLKAWLDREIGAIDNAAVIINVRGKLTYDALNTMAINYTKHGF